MRWIVSVVLACVVWVGPLKAQEYERLEIMDIQPVWFAQWLNVLNDRRPQAPRSGDVFADNRLQEEYDRSFQEMADQFDRPLNRYVFESEVMERRSVLDWDNYDFDRHRLMICLPFSVTIMEMARENLELRLGDYGYNGMNARDCAPSTPKVSMGSRVWIEFENNDQAEQLFRTIGDQRPNIAFACQGERFFTRNVKCGYYFVEIAVNGEAILYARRNEDWKVVYIE